jgi:hypothetical protein
MRVAEKCRREEKACFSFTISQQLFLATAFSQPFESALQATRTTMARKMLVMLVVVVMMEVVVVVAGIY